MNKAGVGTEQEGRRQVLNFRRKKQPSVATVYRQHRRSMLVGIAVIALVMFAVRHFTAKPAVTQWVAVADQAATQDTANSPAEDPKVDTRLPPAVKPDTPPDAVLIAPTVEAAADPSGRYYPGVKPALLSTIQDGTLQNRPAEREVFFHFMELLAKSEPAAFDRFLKQKNAEQPVAYLQIFRQPNHYRGQVVRVRANVRRVHPVIFRKNALGIENYYHLWLEAANQKVIAVYALELPEGFPVSEEAKDGKISEVWEEVEVDGFFYKLLAYQSYKDTETAPLILAKTIKWHKSAPVVNEPVTWQTIWPAVLGGVLLGALVLLYYIRPALAQYGPKEPIPDPSPAAFNELKAVPEATPQPVRFDEELKKQVPVQWPVLPSDESAPK